MEEILSSIKRIIAEEGDGGATIARNVRRTPRPAGGRSSDDGDGILELRDAVDDDATGDAPAPKPKPKPVETPRAEAREKREAPDDTMAASKAEFETMLSERAAEASRGQLETLSRMIVKPAAQSASPGSDTLEGLVREMLRPMLSEWLDANLPQIVETMVAREIKRITSRDD